MTYPDDATRWAAVQARDPLADGHFVYAVKTTRIFCRPICKARLARRANVSFFGSGELAREAGFRACKRCRPLGAGGMPEDAAVQRVRAFVEGRVEKLSPSTIYDAHDAHGQHDERDSHGSHVKHGTPGRGRMRGTTHAMTLAEMARATGLSKWHFHRVFKRCVGMTPAEYVYSYSYGYGYEYEHLGAKAEETRRQAAVHRATMMGLAADVRAYGDWLRQQGVVDDDEPPPPSLVDSEESALSGLPSDSECLLSFEDFVSWPGDDELPV